MKKPGVLAFAIPFHKENKKNSSYKLQHRLHYPVAFFILPIFALANTAIVFPNDLISNILTSNSIGIICDLVVGKFAGIFLTSFVAVKTGIASLSTDLNWRHIVGISLLAGIGFTMSIFIANLAFGSVEIITASKLSILLASFFAAIMGLIVLKSKK